MKAAGIKVRMITGDNKVTAKSIGLESGILIDESKSIILEGNEFINLIGGLVYIKNNIRIILKRKNKRILKLLKTNKHLMMFYKILIY